MNKTIKSLDSPFKKNEIDVRSKQRKQKETISLWCIPNGMYERYRTKIVACNEDHDRFSIIRPLEKMWVWE